MALLPADADRKARPMSEPQPVRTGIEGACSRPGGNARSATSGGDTGTISPRLRSLRAVGLRSLRVVVAGLVMTVALLVAGGLGAGRTSAQATPTGSVTGFGDATEYGALTASQVNAPVAGMAPTPDGRGYWFVGADGGVFTFGDAGFYGSEAGQGVQTPFVAIAATPDGRGYWVAGDFGNVYNFGDAPNEGSIPGEFDAPVVGIAANPNGVGYWLVGADGGVFTFGDATFYGSMGGKLLNAPVVGMTSTPDGHGYWLVAADGGVFSFGDASFYGSMGAAPPNGRTPIVAMASTPDGHGYWLAATAAELPPPTPVPSVLAQCNYPGAAPSVEPSAIVLACGDGNASLTHLIWSSWTKTTAAATGDFTHNSCIPDCAQGTFVSTPASVRLGYPIETSAGQEFASLSYDYADSSAPGGTFTYTSVAPTSPG